MGESVIGEDNLSGPLIADLIPPWLSRPPHLSVQVGFILFPQAWPSLFSAGLSFVRAEKQVVGVWTLESAFSTCPSVALCLCLSLSLSLSLSFSFSLSLSLSLSSLSSLSPCFSLL